MADVGSVVDDVERDLAAGRVPRARQRLTEAARHLRQAGRISEASRAFRVLARLERRRGKQSAALAAARSALRVARQAGEGEAIAAAHALLAELLAEGGDPRTALKHALQFRQLAEARTSGAGIAAAMQLLTTVSLAARDYASSVQYAESAVTAAEEAEPDQRVRSRRLLAISLLHAGCSRAAVGTLSPLLSSRELTALDVPTLATRGFAYLCLGELSAAGRDLRKAARLSKRQEDRRPEAQMLAAQALAEAMLARATDRPTRAARAAAQAGRAVRLARRLRDPRTVAAVEWMADALRKNPAPFGGKPVRPTAGELVELADQADCLTLVDACLAEVMRLEQFPEEEIIRRCTFLPPVCFQ